MRFQIIGLESGEVILPEQYETFLLTQGGEVLIQNNEKDTQDSVLEVYGGYVVEVAFDSVHGEWNYEHCVVVND